MKSIFTIFFTLIVLFPSITKTGVFIWFKANQNYIATTLCVKKDFKKNECQGCCQLVEKLNTVSESSTNSTIPLKLVKVDTEWFWIANNLSSIFFTAGFKGVSYSFLLFEPKNTFLDAVFHPPQNLS